MPLFGAHMSVAGGLANAFTHIRAVDGEALQIFTRNQRQWEHKPVTVDEAAAFRDARAAWGDYPVASHDAYLINLASADEAVRAKSRAAMAEELTRCATLDIPYVVMHPGSHGGAGMGRGAALVARGLDAALDSSPGPSDGGPMVLLENTAGQGTSLGGRFEELAAVISLSRHSERLGVCLDTCHAFAAGYALHTAEGYAAMWDEFEAHLDLGRLRFFHLNDAKGECGSRLDRHTHIGQGHIGREGFARLVTDPRFAAHPMVLETPKGKDLELDRMNLAVLRELAGQDGGTVT